MCESVSFLNGFQKIALTMGAVPEYTYGNSPVWPTTYRHQAYEVMVFTENGHYYAMTDTGNVFCIDSPTACIQEAINYVAQLGGGVIYIKTGIYNLFSPVNLISNNIWLIGEGRSTILMRPNNTNYPAHSVIAPYHPMVNISNSQDIVIENIALDGNQANNQPPSDDGGNINLLIYSSQNVFVRNLWSYEPTGDGINIYNSYNVAVENAVLYSSYPYYFAGAGIGGSTNVFFKNVYIRDFNHNVEIFGSSYQTGISTTNRNHTYVDLILERSTASGYTLTASLLYDATFINLRSYVLSSNIGGGLYFQGVDNIQFYGGHVLAGVGAWALDFEGGTYPVSNIVIRDMKIEQGSYGIVLHSVQNAIIEGCEFIPPLSPQNQFLYMSIPSGSSYPMRNAVVRNNYFGNLNGDTAVEVDSGDTIYIEENYFDGSKPFWTSVVTNIVVRRNKGYVTENHGVATFSGNGSSTQFNITHGLVSTPSKIQVIPGSSDAAGSFYVTADSTYIYVNYITAPPSGTNNIVLYWYAEV